MMVEFAKGRQKEERKRKRDSTQNAQNGTPPSAAKVPRRSLRSQGKRPSSSADDPGEGTLRQSFKSDKSSDEDKENIEGNKPKRYRLPTARPVSKAVEDITQPMLNNISRKVSTKVYGYKGTTCHQCRQKTLDQKTYCRNIHCIGLRGMFCGVCLKNRYGEDVAEALLDPNWRCPVCRGICNCSLCRELKGKRPTGVLMPLALKNGYSSVREFLMSLGNEEDFPEDFRNPKKLLGFTGPNNIIAKMGGNLHYVMQPAMDVSRLYKAIERLKAEIANMRNQNIS